MKKNILDFIKCNTRQIFEVLALIVAIAIPWVVNLQELFKEYLANNFLEPDNMWWYLALTIGKPKASLILFFLLLLVIRRINAEIVMNSKYVYHDYCYGWYWFCAQILGIKKCSLILVPIHMQFKLTIRGTFSDYPLQDEDYPIVDNEPDCNVSITHEDKDRGTINLILEDTYSVGERQISKNNRELYTIKVSRYDGSNSRHFSQKLIDATAKALNEYKRIPIVNIYATTNPKNTFHIARRVFGSIGRGNVEHLYVFQQSTDSRRMFDAEGHKVF